MNDAGLETLKLESNGVGDGGVEELSRTLAKNNKLLVLSVRRNSVTDAGAKMLAVALESNRTLTHLDLLDNSVTDVGAQALLAAIQKAKRSGSQLQSLDLEVNDVSTAIKDQIAVALK